MPRLTFIKSEIEQLIAAARKHRNAINLVGEQGVYFATSTTEIAPPLCVYATNCNPDAPHGDWAAVKRKTFGADDGVEPVTLGTLEGWVRRTSGDVLSLEINQAAVTPIADDSTPVDSKPRSPVDIFDVLNDARAARAQATLKFYADSKGQPLIASSAQISDLISDLLHLAAYRGYGPKAVDGIVSLARLNHPAQSDDLLDAPPSGHAA